MSALRDVQELFLHDIYAGTHHSAPFLDVEKTPLSRMKIYHHNTILALADLLADFFPVLKLLVGDNFFRKLARDYSQLNPQPTGNRITFGAHFPEFVATYKGLESLPYLSDVARLEWAYFQCALALDAVPLGFDDLQQALEANPEFALALHPSVQIITQSYNALEIWQAHQETPIETVSLQHKPHSLLVWRNVENNVFFQSVNQSLLSLLVSVRQGDSLINIISNLSQDSDIQQIFASAMAQGLFINPDLI
jgi:hypothetical protein